jgi:uncharacterized protein YyaL (SSP411 family)
VAPHNRLANEASPYLLQHADNPVDWWPWGPEAFAEAHERDVPVFISVGYSACHWCHVMAHESFEDAEVAAVLNEGFVAVKVDREDRPDVDALYMEAVQLLTGTGGWPMTVLALADGRPFWGGTYLPKANLLRLLRQVSALWRARRGELEADAARLAEALRARPGASPPKGTPLGGTPDSGARKPSLLEAFVAALLPRLDLERGGTAGAPKFPQPVVLEALIRYSWRTGDERVATAVQRWLDAMSSGGIYDHLGGGFARYSTDSAWLVPHFEKMLYDNALLLRAYTLAWQLTGSARYRQVAEETAGYLLSAPLRLPEGAWASAEDADSEGEEGRFYTWSREEVEKLAGPATADWYGVSSAGNWEGKNILWRPGTGTLVRPPEVEEGRRLLLAARSKRPRPGLDDKVLTEWNAMAVAALAYAGRAFGEEAWVEAARSTAEVLLANLRRPDGRWLRSWRPAASRASSGQAPLGPPAFAGDYAWLVEAFTRLGEATGEAKWAELARETASGLAELFYDEDNGGFFTSGSDAEKLVARLKDIFDGAVPSANSVAANALARLGELSGEGRWRRLAEETVESLAGYTARLPAAFPGIALAEDFLVHPRRQVVITSPVASKTPPSSRQVTPELARPVFERYLPDTVLAWGEPYASPLWAGRLGAEAAGLAFVCRDYACELPVRTADELGRLLQGPSGGIHRSAHEARHDS